MDFLTLAKKRCSVRQYQDKPVEQEKLDLILSAGRVAPTAANKQPQRIVVIQSAEGLEKLKKAANVYGAPLAMIVCADHQSSWKRPFDGKDAADIDATIVTTHMMLQAAGLGLGSIWVCFFDPIVREMNLLYRRKWNPLTSWASVMLQARLKLQTDMSRSVNQCLTLCFMNPFKVTDPTLTAGSVFTSGTFSAACK